jgi:hypothetical protein
VPLLVNFDLTVINRNCTNVPALDRLDQLRYQALDNLISAQEALLEDFLHNRNSCTFECNALHYGALTKELWSRGLMNPRPQIPFLGYSFNDTVTSIRSIPDIMWYDADSRNRAFDSTHQLHGCKLTSQLATIIGSIEDNLNGLSLKDVLPENLEA